MPAWNQLLRPTAGLTLALCLGAVGAACSSSDGNNTQAETKPPRVKPTDLPPFSPGSSGLRRLTTEQYANSIHDLIAPDIVVPTAIEPDVEAEGLVAIGSGVASISSRGVEQYEAAAYDVANQAMDTPGTRAKVIPCTPAGAVDSACSKQFITAFGRRAWRRSLTTTEIDALAALSDKAAMTLNDFYKGAAFGMAAILMSPNFLYRAEVGADDGSGQRRFNDFELASKLSFLLWNTTPDDALLDAAEKGELSTDEGLKAQAERLLNDARARKGLRSFFSDMLHLHKLKELTKDSRVFVHMSSDVGPSAKEETLLSMENLVFDEEGDYRDFYTSKTTFLNRKLASIYGVKAPAKEGFGKTTYKDDNSRRGFLGQVAFLALNSHPTGSSATLRGKFIKTSILCGIIPPPPAMANTGLPEPSGTTITLRDRVKEHLVNPECNACHSLMDPIGLTFEKFDGLGGYREKDNGAEIDTSGGFDNYEYKDFTGLTQVVHDHPDLSKCLVRTMYRYTTGRVDSDTEAEALWDLQANFEDNGYKVKDLVLNLVTHPSFRLNGAPAANTEGQL